MAIVVECALCGKKNKFADDQAGRVVPCRECGVSLEIPGHSSGLGDEAASRSSSTIRAGKRRNQAKRPALPPRAMLGVIGGAVALVLLLTLLMQEGGEVAVPPMPPDGEVADPFGSRSLPPPVAVQPTPPQANPTGPVGTSSRPEATPRTVTTTSADKPAQNPGQPRPAGEPTASNKKPPSRSSSLPGKSSAGDPSSSTSTPQWATTPEPARYWNLSPDPAPEPLPDTWNTEFEIRVATTASNLLESHVVYPKTPSPYVLVGTLERDKQVWQVWDLSRGVLHDTLREDIPGTAKLALSPDARFAVWTAALGGLDVYDLGQKKLLGNFPASGNDGERFNVADLTLLPGGRMVAQASSQQKVKVWQLPEGKLLQAIPLGDRFVYAEKTAFSPGGRYMAVEAHHREWLIRVYDLLTGEIVGEIQLQPQGSLRNLAQLAFSPDGNELACVMEVTNPFSVTQILLWGLVDGQVKQNLVLSPSISTKYQPAPGALGLQWSPDGQRFLVHNTVLVDRATQNVLYVLDQAAIEGKSPRKLLAKDLIAAYEGTQRQGVIKPIRIQQTDIAQVQAVSEAGGRPEDLKLPRLTKAGAVSTAPRPQATSFWTILPDPAPLLPARVLLEPLPIQLGNQAIRRVFIQGGEEPKAFVHVQAGTPAAPRPPLQTSTERGKHSANNTAPPPPQAVQECRVDVYDLVARRSLAPITIPFAAEVVAVSPDATRLAVQPIKAPGRLDLYSLQGEHWLGFRPQGERQGPQLPFQTVQFLDPEHLLTLQDGLLVVWSLPACQPQYQVPDVSQVVVTPGGRFLACVQDRQVEFRDALNGAGRGTLSLPGRIHALAFHPQGERLAMVFQQRGVAVIALVDLKTGNIQAKVPCPVMEESLHWCHDRYLLCGRTALFDILSKTIVWRYKLHHAVVAAQHPDVRLWYAAPRLSHPNEWFLLAVSLPEENVAAHLEKQELEPEWLAQPGQPVYVKWDFKPAPWAPALAPSLPKLVRTALEQNGFEVSSKSDEPLKIVITGTAKTGPSFELPYQGQTLTRQTLPDHQYEIKVVYSAGEEILWQTEQQFSTKSSFHQLAELPSNKPAQQVLNDLTTAAIQQFCRDLQIPAYVFSKRSIEGLGVTLLSGDGAATTSLPK